jgi:L-asparagine transporter-like permease
VCKIQKTINVGTVSKHQRKAARKRGGKLNEYSLAGLGIGGVIGAGYFLGSGLAVREAGPSVSLAFLIGSLLMMQVLGAMTSINVNRLQQGSFRVYIEHFLGQYAGFLIGWALFVSSILAIGSEAIAMGVFAHYWLPKVPLPVLAIVFMAVIIVLNAMNMEIFGPIESGMAVVKVAALIAFIAVGAWVLFTQNGMAARNPFSSPHAFFPKGISGLLQSMLVVIFSFSGISAVAMASTEVAKPRIQIPRAAGFMVFGSAGLYVLSMLVLVMLTAWNTVSVHKSPFVHALDVIGMSGAASFFNIVILLAAFSVMAASYYTSVQLIVSLSEAKKGPHLFLRHAKNGLYRYAWLTAGAGCLLVVGLSFLLPAALYNYLVSASSYITFLNWALNLITFLVWRKKRSEHETYQSKLIWGVPGAYASLFAIMVLFVMSLRVADFRMGFYAALCFFLLITAAYAVWKKAGRRTEQKTPEST